MNNPLEGFSRPQKVKMPLAWKVASGVFAIAIAIAAGHYGQKWLENQSGDQLRPAEVVTLSANNVAGEDKERAVFLDGLTLPGFVKAFNGHAKFDQEPLIEIQGCEQTGIPHSRKKAFACTTGGNTFLDGVVKEDGTLQHISVSGKPASTDDLHRYRRASGYLVRAAKGGSILGVGTVVSELLGATAQANGRPHQINAYGLNMSASRDQFGWSFGVEADYKGNKKSIKGKS